MTVFVDGNKNVYSTMEERLQNEHKLDFEVYSQLAKQLLRAQLKVKEDTPIFLIVNSVTAIIEKSKSNHPMI